MHHQSIAGQKRHMGQTRRGMIGSFHMAQSLFPTVNAEQGQAMGGAKADLTWRFANHR